MEPLKRWDRSRRPTQPYPRYALEDAQGALPTGWCNGCGKEIYAWPVTELCKRCEQEGKECSQ